MREFGGWAAIVWVYGFVFVCVVGFVVECRRVIEFRLIDVDFDDWISGLEYLFFSVYGGCVVKECGSVRDWEF